MSLPCLVLWWLCMGSTIKLIFPCMLCKPGRSSLASQWPYLLPSLQAYLTLSLTCDGPEDLIVPPGPPWNNFLAWNWKFLQWMHFINSMAFHSQMNLVQLLAWSSGLNFCSLISSYLYNEVPYISSQGSKDLIVMMRTVGIIGHFLRVRAVLSMLHEFI